TADGVRPALDVLKPRGFSRGDRPRVAGDFDFYHICESCRAFPGKKCSHFVVIQITERYCDRILIGRFCGMKKARIVVADDHAITLAGLRMLIEAHSDFELVGAAQSGPEALAAVLKLKPDIAILDVSLPEINGIAVARRLARECPSAGVIVLTGNKDRRYLNQALEAGAGGLRLQKFTD